MIITPEAIDAAAKHLREVTQRGKQLNEWATLPRVSKKKWVLLATGALQAAMATQETPNAG